MKTTANKTNSANQAFSSTRTSVAMTTSDLLSSFTLYAKDLKVPMITVYPHTIHFNKESYVSLDYVPYVKILVDKAGRRIAIVKAEGNELGSRKFFEHHEGKQNTVRFASKEIVDLFLETAGLSELDWSEEKKGIRFSGEKIDGAIIYNLSHRS